MWLILEIWRYPVKMPKWYQKWTTAGNICPILVEFGHVQYIPGIIHKVHAMYNGVVL